MRLKTRHFGEIEIDQNQIFTFEEGLPGFERVKQFILLAVNEQDSPFSWLQSIEDYNLAFAVVNPFMIKNDYEDRKSTRLNSSH